MNETMGLNNSLFSVFGSSVAGLGTTVPSAGNAAMNEVGAQNFQDLLSLVSDTAVADEQSGILDETIENGAKDLLKENSLGQLELAAMHADLMGIATAKTGMNVGQEVAAKPLVETKPVTNLSQNMQELQLFAQQNATSKVQDTQASAESVEQWAAALASGDIKSVGFETPAETKNSVASTALANAKSAPTPLSASQNLSALTTGVANEESAKNLKTGELAGSAKTATKPATASTGAAVTSIGDFLLAKSDKDAAQNADSQSQQNANDSKSRSAQNSPVKNAEVMNANDFVLQQAAAVNAAPKQVDSSLVGKSQIGSPSDSRISADALSFVADKVDALKAQGGGVLKVEMSPKDLGSVQIKVSMARGELKVEVLAEKPETLQALTASKDDLASRLKTISPSKLDLGSLYPSKNMAEAQFSKVRASNEGAASSQELLNLRSDNASAASSESKLARDVSQPVGRDILSTGVNSASSLGEGRSTLSSQSGQSDSRHSSDGQSGRPGQEWSRDEKREKARDRWEEFFEDHKKSA